MLTAPGAGGPVRADVLSFLMQLQGFGYVVRAQQRKRPKQQEFEA